MAETTFDAKIKDLGDKLAALTLKDAVDLGKYMKETYGIEAAAGGAVVMAAAGYPAAPRKGDVITGLPADTDEAVVFHAGTALLDGKLQVTGGRVLCVTALGDSVKLAQQHALQALSGIHFDGAQYRRDIGHRAIKR